MTAAARITLITLGADPALQVKSPGERRVDVLAQLPAEERGVALLEAFEAIDRIVGALRSSAEVAAWLDVQSDVIERALEGPSSLGT